MKPNTRIALAGLLSAAGSLLNAFAAEFGGEATPETPAPKRGKKTTEKPVDPPAETTTTETAAEEPDPAGEGKTYEELRALIEPLVKSGQGEEVKRVIKKYAGEGGSLKTMEAKHHAAFEKDIAALAY